jgi:hypothetical protein
MARNGPLRPTGGHPFPLSEKLFGREKKMNNEKEKFQNAAESIMVVISGTRH